MRNRGLVFIGIAVIVFFGGMALIVNDYLGWNRGGRAYSRLIGGGGVGLSCIAIGWWPFSTPLRVLFGIVGAALLLYGLASITGGWLGVAPWQWRAVDSAMWLALHPDMVTPSMLGDSGTTMLVRDASRWGVLSVELMAVGIVLIAVAVWPRYYRDPPAES